MGVFFFEFKSNNFKPLIFTLKNHQLNEIFYILRNKIQILTEKINIAHLGLFFLIFIVNLIVQAQLV